MRAPTRIAAAGMTGNRIRKAKDNLTYRTFPSSLAPMSLSPIASSDVEGLCLMERPMKTWFARLLIHVCAKDRFGRAVRARRRTPARRTSRFHFLRRCVALPSDQPRSQPAAEDLATRPLRTEASIARRHEAQARSVRPNSARIPLSIVRLPALSRGFVGKEPGATERIKTNRRKMPRCSVLVRFEARVPMAIRLHEIDFRRTQKGHSGIGRPPGRCDSCLAFDGVAHARSSRPPPERPMTGQRVGFESSLERVRREAGLVRRYSNFTRNSAILVAPQLNMISAFTHATT
jgi:hypothetical protein